MKHSSDLVQNIWQIQTYAILEGNMENIDWYFLSTHQMQRSSRWLDHLARGQYGKYWLIFLSASNAMSRAKSEKFQVAGSDGQSAIWKILTYFSLFFHECQGQKQRSSRWLDQMASNKPWWEPRQMWNRRGNQYQITECKQTENTSDNLGFKQNGYI